MLIELVHGLSTDGFRYYLCWNFTSFTAREFIVCDGINCCKEKPARWLGERITYYFVHWHYTVKLFGRFHVFSSKSSHMTSNKPEPFTLLLGFQIKNRSLQFDNFCPCFSPWLSYTLDTHLLSCLFFQGKVSQKKQMTESKRDTSVGLLCVFQRLPRECTIKHSPQFHGNEIHYCESAFGVFTYMYVCKPAFVMAVSIYRIMNILLLLVWRYCDSTFGPAIGILIEAFVVFVSPTWYMTVWSSIGPRLLPPKSFSVHLSLVIQPFAAA